MSAGVLARDVFMRYTDAAGKTYVRAHRVWDGERFVANQINASAIEAGKARDTLKPSAHKAEQITDEQFQKERK